MKTLRSTSLCQSPTSDQELLLGEADVHGMLKSHFESLQGILGVSGLPIRLKLYKGNVTASRHQTNLLEPREPVSGGGAAQIQGKRRKGLSTNGMSVWLYTIEMLVPRHAHTARYRPTDTHVERFSHTLANKSNGIIDRPQHPVGPLLISHCMHFSDVSL